MKIKILKQTPYRRNIEREIKIGEIHQVERVRPHLGNHQLKGYFFIVDDRERFLLDSDCEIIKEGE